jgi:enterochelin esterase-like enzyme
MIRRFPSARALFACALALSFPIAARAADLTPSSLLTQLKAEPKGDDARALAAQVQQWFGGAENLKKGPGPKTEGTAVAWAIEAPGASAAPKVVSQDGKSTFALSRIGDTDVYATAVALPEGFGMPWAFEVDGKTIPHPSGGPSAGGAAKKFRPAAPAFAPLEVYSEHPDSRVSSDVPKGKLIQPPKFKSQVFEGTTRDWWIYVPAQYTGDAPAAVMVFQDGGGYKDFVPTVFDNLIAKKEMPVTVGVFVNPGTFEGGRSNRSFEYDTLSDQYPRFLLEEILPETEKAANVKLRKDAAGRATAGISSGGICAFTAAWERPNEFSKVLSWVGSFTNIASGKSGHDGGHNYEAMVRKTPKKPIRVFLQDGSNDLDNNNGNWPLANQTLAKSLAFAKYDYMFVYGQGFHSNRQGRAILPDSLRWLWRDWQTELPK